mmetsp:Transcript_30620/g.96157  ORF Transcript_30620/g.96157 Transcript_30620/m.96157 type:complete len:384 (+) Transcript_30620:634-1785(+)
MRVPLGRPAGPRLLALRPLHRRRAARDARADGRARGAAGRLAAARRGGAACRADRRRGGVGGAAAPALPLRRARAAHKRGGRLRQERRPLPHHERAARAVAAAAAVEGAAGRRGRLARAGRWRRRRRGVWRVCRDAGQGGGLSAGGCARPAGGRAHEAGGDASLGASRGQGGVAAGPAAGLCRRQGEGGGVGGAEREGEAGARGSPRAVPPHRQGLPPARALVAGGPPLPHRRGGRLLRLCLPPVPRLQARGDAGRVPAQALRRQGAGGAARRPARQTGLAPEEDALRHGAASAPRRLARARLRADARRLRQPRRAPPAHGGRHPRAQVQGPLPAAGGAGPPPPPPPRRWRSSRSERRASLRRGRCRPRVAGAPSRTAAPTSA